MQQANQKKQLFYVERPLTAGNVCVLMLPLGYFSADILMSASLQWWWWDSFRKLLLLSGYS